MDNPDSGVHFFKEPAAFKMAPSNNRQLPETVNAVNMHQENLVTFQRRFPRKALLPAMEFS